MKILILGGGIGGLTTALALSRAGHDVRVFESAGAWQPLGAGIVLAANAMRVYESLGLTSALLRQGNALARFTICDQSGRALMTMDSGTVHERFGLTHQLAIHRAELHQILLQELPESRVFLNRKGVSCKQTADSAEVTFSDGTKETADLLVVADGIHSAIRQQLVPGSAPRYAGYTCWRAVMKGSVYDSSHATETWGRAGRIGIVPLTDRRLYVFLCVNAARENPPLLEDVLAAFASYHSPVSDVIRQMARSSFIQGPIQDIRPLSRWVFGRVVLLGDAAHATTPNLGQGACQAIEDAYALAQLLGQPEGLARYEKIRQKRTAWVAGQSRQIGRIAQLENPVLISLRNALLRRVPAFVSNRQMERLLGPLSL